MKKILFVVALYSATVLPADQSITIMVKHYKNIDDLNYNQSNMVLINLPYNTTLAQLQQKLKDKTNTQGTLRSKRGANVQQMLPSTLSEFARNIFGGDISNLTGEFYFVSSGPLSTTRATY